MHLNPSDKCDLVRTLENLLKTVKEVEAKTDCIDCGRFDVSSSYCDHWGDQVPKQHQSNQCEHWEKPIPF